MVRKAVGKYTKKQIKKMADDIFGTDKAIKSIGKPGGTKKFKGKGIDKVKKDLKSKANAPIPSERSKITAANAAAKAKRAKAAGKTAGVGAAAKTLTSRTARARNKTASKTGAATSRPGRGVAAAAIAGGVGLTLMNKKSSSGAAKVTFADAFRKARAKGEGTKFTHDGKKYIAVTKTDLKKKGYDDNELAAYNKRGGKARGPLNRLGQGVKKVLLGKDKKFGGDKGVIDFIRKPVKKAGGGMLGPHPQQGRPMNIAAPQGPRAKQPLRNMTIPYGKIAKKGPGMKDGGNVIRGKEVGIQDPFFRKDSMVRSKDSGLRNVDADAERELGLRIHRGPGMKKGGIVNKRKATGAAKRGFGKAYMKGKRS